MQNVFGDKCLDQRFTAAAPGWRSWVARMLPAGLLRTLGGKRECSVCLWPQVPCSASANVTKCALYAALYADVVWWLEAGKGRQPPSQALHPAQ